MDNNFSAETTAFNDPETGVRILGLTDHPADHMNLYITKSSFTSNCGSVVFLSTRNGWSNLYKALLPDGTIAQLTDHKDDIEVFSPVIDHTDTWVYYSLADSIRAVHLNTLEERLITSFSGRWPRSLHLSNDGKFLVTVLGPGGRKLHSALRRVRHGLKQPSDLPDSVLAFSARICQRMLSRKLYSIVAVNTDSSGYRTVLDAEHDIGIALISPDNNEIVYFPRPELQIWAINTTGKHNRPLYGHRDKIWLTHPVWIDETTLAVARWPNALVSLDLYGKSRIISHGNWWHPSISPDRKTIVSDTACPDRGIFLIDSKTGREKVLCHPESRFGGPQWKEPYPEPAVSSAPLGNQWAHPHPSFSPDGKKVLYNSNYGGQYSQIYMALLDQTD